MKGLLKRAAAVLLMAVCLMNLSACSASEDTANAPKIATEGTPADEYTSQMVLQQALSILSISEEQLTIQKGIYESQGSAETIALIDILKEAKSEYGTIHGVDTANAKVVLLPDQTYTPVSYTHLGGRGAAAEVERGGTNGGGRCGGRDRARGNK